MPRARWICFAAAFALGLSSACGSERGDGTASPRPDSGAARDDSAEPDDEMTVLVRFAKCMRDEGVDYPDPQRSEDGMVTFGAGPGSPPGPEMDAALAKCDPILEEGLGQGLRPDPDQVEEQLDQMLAFAKCMREQGVDWQDPTIVNGRPSMGAGDFGGDPAEMEAAMAECNNGPGGPVFMGTPGQTDGTP